MASKQTQLSRIVNTLQPRTERGTDLPRFFVLTGGPGSGKSTLPKTLSERGSTCVAEAGREIIRDQVANGGTALPWADQQAFAELMLALDIQAYRCAQTTAGIVLFDRGIPDIIGYRRLVGLPVPDHLEKAARRFRYRRLVFIAPPWADYGYELVPLPLASIEARATFVMEAIDRCT